MGYVSLSEDIANKIFEMRELIDKNASDNLRQIEKKQARQFSQFEIDEMFEKLELTKNLLYESSSKLNKIVLESKNTSSQIEKMREIINVLDKENETLKFQLKTKKDLLIQLRTEISSILDKNEVARKVSEVQSHENMRNTVHKLNDQNAEIVLELKAGLAQIGLIIQQQNFYKQTENIKNIKLIIKKFTGLY